MKKKLGDFTLFDVENICTNSSGSCTGCPIFELSTDNMTTCFLVFKRLNEFVEIKSTCKLCDGSGKYIDQETELEQDCLECGGEK